MQNLSPVEPDLATGSVIDRLCCSTSLEPWLVRRLGLRVELGTRWLAWYQQMPAADRSAAVAPWEGLVQSLHLHYADAIGRLNIAALEDARRDASLDNMRQGLAAARELGICKVVMHNAPRFWDGQTVGDYDRLVNSLQRLADETLAEGTLICVENNRTYWDGCDPLTPVDRIDRTGINVYFADTPESWSRLVRDVARSNVRLCLDTSHAVTCAQRLPSLDARLEMMHAYLDAGEWIAHVHWNGNYLLDNRGRRDQHLSLHVDAIPLDVHRRVSKLNASLLLERPIDAATLMAEMAFIQQL